MNRIRFALALLVLTAAALGFLVTGSNAETAAHTTARVIAAWQLFPATERALTAGFSIASLAGFFASIAALLILVFTAVFGRWYCAVLCPLGTLQDIASLARRKKHRFSKPLPLLRAASALLAACLISAGAMGLAGWLDPWSLFSRFMTNNLQPLVRLVSRMDVPPVAVGFIIAPAAAMAAILVLSVFFGRWFCGTLCPVGTVLGYLNRVAPFRLRMDKAACISCGGCSKACPASCIDVPAKKIDASRCVYCLACIPTCPTGAIRYGKAQGSRRGNDAAAKREPATGSGLSRAQFIATLGGGTAALLIAGLPGRAFASRTLSRITGSSPVIPVTPPGSGSIGRFLKNCTACGLCVARCPSKVLQPSFGQLGAGGLFVPRLDFGVSYCQYDCTVCLDVCPTGALAKLPVEKKRLTKIGDATLIRNLCIVFTNGTKCGACAEHCPTGAVRMIVGETGLPEPVFTSAICIGCGACHHACPVRPAQAISVSGLAVHEMAEKPSPKLFDRTDATGEPDALNAEEFPF